MRSRGERWLLHFIKRAYFVFRCSSRFCVREKCLFPCCPVLSARGGVVYGLGVQDYYLTNAFFFCFFLNPSNYRQTKHLVSQSPQSKSAKVKEEKKWMSGSGRVGLGSGSVNLGETTSTSTSTTKPKREGSRGKPPPPSTSMIHPRGKNK